VDDFAGGLRLAGFFLYVLARDPRQRAGAVQDVGALEKMARGLRVSD
jgi:hypothetical protein